MSMDRMEHTGFTSGEARGKMRVPGYIGGAIGSSARRNARRLRSRHSGYSGRPRASGMLVKAGLCAAVCAAVLLLRWSQTPEAVLPVSSVQQAVNEQGDGYGDTLGRLRFVELPSIIEVFSSSVKPGLGMEYSQASLDGDTLLATLSLAESQPVPAPAACKVKEMGEDPALGLFVRLVFLEGDREVTYYGLKDVQVEEGQQLSQGDTVAQAEGEIRLAVHRAGRPEDPLSYFGLKTGPV